MSETLTERVANMRSKTDEEVSVKEMAHSVFVEGDEVFVETVKGQKYRFGSVRGIAKNSIKEQMKSFKEQYDVSISSETRKTLENLILSIKQAWDSEIDMFQLDYNTNTNGQISEFYIPFNSEIIDNPTVFQVYDENGEFVAQDVEDEIGTEIAKIETTDLYVDSIPHNNREIPIYKKTRRTQSDLFEEKLSMTTDYDNNRDAIVGLFEGVLAGMLIPMIYLTFGLNLYIFILIYILFPKYYLDLIPRIFTISFSMIISMIYANKNEGIAEKKVFFTVR